MLPLRRTGFWRLASSFFIVIVLVGTLMPVVWFWDDRDASLRWIRNLDKWVHALTFLCLAIWFGGLYQKSNYWMIGLGLLLFGLAIEGCQYLVGYRSADWLDVGANTTGIVIGLAVSLAGLGGWCQWLEDRWSGASAGNRID